MAQAVVVTRVQHTGDLVNAAGTVDGIPTSATLSLATLNGLANDAARLSAVATALAANAPISLPNCLGSCSV